MKAVVINGTVVLEDDTIVEDVFPGQPIRFDPEARPRFEPVDPEAWNRMFEVAVEVPGTDGIPLPQQ